MKICPIIPANPGWWYVEKPSKDYHPIIAWELRKSESFNEYSYIPVYPCLPDKYEDEIRADYDFYDHGYVIYDPSYTAK
ncbi:hypothetical protein OO7_12269 [Providencia sneebia DSM 19967]|uniref:Uncharacterized protein n=1 Tax=Providencia sneebia DSM 19967 TaxID=1141660 RepID=K8W5E4_9GAMM|nr:hypothetical protein OO7_12269 [Providencia sneebia DSM 19967]